MQPRSLFRGMTGFTVVWLGQIVSLLGTNMSTFALTIWAYEISGSATALALVQFFFVTPMVLVMPLAGALVDRSSRKLLMMVSDLSAGVASVFILVLYVSGQLQIWHLYVAAALQGAFQSFQWPAYSAAISTMLPKEHYGRANGMLSLAEAGSTVFGPLLAGALLGVIHMEGVLLLDLISCAVAVGALALVHVPQPQITAEGLAGRSNIWKESVYGFRYILQRRSLLGLQLVFMTGNFITGIAFTLAAPMVLARTGNDELIFASVSSIGAVGGVIGGILMGVWGGPRPRIHGVLTGWIFFSLFGMALFGFGQGLVVWAAASFIRALIIPIINGSNQAIWQSKVAPDLQGRVFSSRALIAQVSGPLATLIAGPLADRLMEPAMQTGGFLTPVFADLVGTGPGAGMALIFIFCGLLTTLVGITGYAIPAIRMVESRIPDHDQLAPAPAAATSG